MKISRFLTTLFVACLCLFVFALPAKAQYCGGGVSCCSNWEDVRTPEGCSTHCSPTDFTCKRCTGTTRQCTSHAGSGPCSSWGSGNGSGSGGGCADNCNGIVESGSCTAYTPPPPPTPRPTYTPPQTIPTYAPTPSGTTTTPTPEPPPPPPPPSTYGCNQCTGTCTEGAGDQTADSCSASCTQVYTPGSPACPDAPSVHSTSSCPDDAATAVEDVIMPGQTVNWYTWATPPGATPQERLTNESPGLIPMSYTSPGDTVTVAYMFMIRESQPHTFYIYDRNDKTFFFFNGVDQPPVIAARKQSVVNQAVADGYTWVTDTSVANSGPAQAIQKRVYKLPDDEDQDPWEVNGNPAGIVSHMPYGKTLYQIPYVDCASLIRASFHGDYYSTDINDIDSDQYYCFRRQYLRNDQGIIRWPSGDDDIPDAAHVAGNYLGLEKDLAAIAPPDDPHAWWGRDNPDTDIGETIGSMIWPVFELLAGPRYNRFDNMQWAFMETKANYLARPHSDNRNFRPAFMRQAIVKIPYDLLSPGAHDFYAYTALGDPGNSTPVPDENSSQGCELNNPGGKEVDIPDHPWWGGGDGPDPITYVGPRCEDFTVRDKETDEVIPPGGSVKQGHTYSVTAKAKNTSSVISFYNSSFNAPDISMAPVDNWTTKNQISLFDIIDCGSSCNAQRTDPADTKVLRTAGADQNAFAVTDYIDTKENVTGHTYTVEFWAKVDGTSRTIPHTYLEREQRSITEPPYYAPTDPNDIRELRFANEATADPNDTTGSITVTNEWQKFIGTVTFNYTTDDPSGHPSGNTSTAIRINLGVPTNTATIYYDDVTLIGWKQPVVYYRMASAKAGDDNPTNHPETIDQCSDTHMFADYGDTATNGSGGLFWADMTVKTTAPVGPYNIFAALQTAPGYTYVGNPNDNDNCVLADPAHWDDSIADPPLDEEINACMRSVNVVACNETTPAKPVIVSVQNASNTLPNVPDGVTDPNPTPNQNEFNDIRVADTNNPTLVITAQPAANSHVTGMVMNITPYGDDSPSEFLTGVPVGGNNYQFTYNVKGTLTNELTISISAVNKDSCNDKDGLISQELIRNVRLMKQRSGYLIEIPKTAVSTYNCKDTYDSLAGKPDTYKVVDLTNQTSVSLSAVTTDSFATMNVPFSTSYGTFKQLSIGPLQKNYITDLPFNASNSAVWRNQISSFKLTLPPNNQEESYVCVNACNPNVGTATNPICQAANTITSPNMKIPKPDYSSTYPSPDFSNDLNIYVAKGSFNDPWWQARGGLVFANGIINSALPLFSHTPRKLCQDQMSSDVCQPFIGAKALGFPGGNSPADKSDPSAGILITNSTTVNPSDYATQRASQQFAQSSLVATNLESYTHFWEMVDSGKVNALAPLSGNVLTGKPTGSTVYDTEDDGTKTLKVYRYVGNLDINLSNTQISVGANEKIIVFVDETATNNGTGNLTLFANSGANLSDRIKVAPGGFLAFIVKNNIIVDGQVGTTDYLGKTPVIQGMFFAGNTLTIDTLTTAVGDKKFIGKGSFIGYQHVNLNRDYKIDTDEFSREKNSQSPTEQFIYDPDLFINAPELLKQPDLKWQEIN